MKERELISNGFQKQEFDREYWYELRYENHLFITNDTSYNERKDVWHIGYKDENEHNGDYCWFNNNLKDVGDFKTMFRILTGVELKLAHQKRIVNKAQ